MEDFRINNNLFLPPLRNISFDIHFFVQLKKLYVVEPKNFPFYKCQYRAESEAARAKKREKVETELEPK